MACLYLIQILTYILRMCLDEKRKRRSGYLDKQKVLKKGLGSYWTLNFGVSVFYVPGTMIST